MHLTRYSLHMLGKGLVVEVSLFLFVEQLRTQILWSLLLLLLIRWGLVVIKLASITYKGYCWLWRIVVIILSQPRLLLFMMSLNLNLIPLRSLVKEITFLRIVMIEASFDTTLIILLYYRRCIVTLRYNTGLLPAQSLNRLTVNYLAVCRGHLRLDVCRGIHFIH